MSKRKKMKLTIETTEQDLLKLEDFMFTIPLCKTHNELAEKQSEKELMGWHYTCPDCKKVFQKNYKGAKRIVLSLFRAEHALTDKLKKDSKKTGVL